MANKLSKTLQAIAGGCAIAMTSLTFSITGASAQQQYIFTEDGFTQGTIQNGRIANRRTVIAERYIPTIWVDPDGCEHWVMDDGWEGFMTPHVTRDGRPVCRRGNTCAVMNSDQLFATNQHSINAANRARLQQFFQSAGAGDYRATPHPGDERA